MTVRSRSQGRKRFYYFVCASYDGRGTSVCRNGLLLPMAQADEAILGEISDVVLDPSIVEGAIEDAVQELRPSRDSIEGKRQALERDLRKVDETQGRYVAAIAAAGPVEALARALKECEQTRQRLRHELAALEGLDRLSTFDVQRIKRDLRARVNEWRGLLKRQTPIARQVLSRLLDGRIEWTPNRDQGIYEFAGRVKFDRLLSGIVFTEGLASPTGTVTGWNRIFAGFSTAA